MTKHSHPVVDECTDDCPRFDPKGWRCSMCARQLPMAADTEDWAAPLCGVCFERAGDEVAP